LHDAALCREKDVILREIDMTADDPDRTLSRTLFATALRQHPARHPVIGHRELFSNVTRDALHAYYRQRYHPDNMVLVIAGDVDAADVDRAVDKWFAPVPRRFPVAVTVPAEPQQLAERQLLLHGDYHVAKGIISFKIPHLTDPTAVQLDVLATCLGGGLSSRLWQQLREQRELVTDISAGAWNPLHPGLFIINYQCAPERHEQVEQAILELLARLPQQPFTRAEIDKARRQAMVSEIESRQNISGMASRHGLINAIVGEPGYIRRYFHLLDQVDEELLAATAGRTFVHDRMTRVAMLPERNNAVVSRPPHKHRIEDFQLRELANGARIVWQRDPRLPRLHVRLATCGGPLFDPSGKTGCSTLLSTLLTKDSVHRSAADVATLLESQGTHLREVVGNQTLHVFMDMAPDLFASNLTLLRELIDQPLLSESAFAREKASHLADLHEQMDDVVSWSFRRLRGQYFGQHPFAHGPHGCVESISAIQSADVRTLHAQLLSANNRVVVLSGACEPDAMLDELETWPGGLPAGQCCAPLDAFTLPTEPRQVTEFRQREQAVVFDAYPDPGYMDDAHYCALILDEILSDMSGPLFKAVRDDRGMAYFVGATRIASRHHGAFVLYAGTHPRHVADVYAQFDRQLDNLRGGRLAAPLLDAARTRLKVQQRFTMQAAGARAMRAAALVLDGKSPMDWVNDAARLDAVTMDRLVAFADTYLQPQRRLRFTVLPES
jgi:zinc protease